MVTKVSSLVIIQSGKRGIQKADNLNTNLGIYTKNIINQSTPKLENAYYGTKVFLYTPENIIKGMMGADVLNGAILPDPPSTPTQSLGFSIKRFIFDQNFSSPFENQKDINE